MKYKLLLTENQIKVLKDALDIYARLGLGQIERIHELIPTDINTTFDKADEAEKILAKYKKDMTGFDLWATHSMSSFQVEDKFKIAYDIKQVIDYYFNVSSDYGYSYNKKYPYPYSSEEFPMLITDDK